MISPLDFIESKRSFYEDQTIEVPGNDEFSQANLIHAINCARLSRYVSGDASDDIIGEYPYDNISKFRIRLEARATDFDTSQIVIEPKDGSRKSRISAMVASKVLRQKMAKIRFGNTLNKITDTLPEYGGVLVKKTKDGVHVVPWENVITDMSNIMGGVIIEKHYYLPHELKKMGWDNVDKAIMTAAREEKDQTISDDTNENIDTISAMIEVWELHGSISVAMYKFAQSIMDDTDFDCDEDDYVTYTNAKIICAPQGKDKDGKMQGVFFAVNEEGPLEETYRYKSRNPLSGRGLGQGIPEELDEHQRWHNFYKTEEARSVAIGGKILFVTNDGNVTQSIYDEGIEHGTIMQVGENKEFKQLNTQPSSVPVYQAIRGEWSESGDKLTNSFAVALGSQEFSDTPFKAQYLQDINSNSQFKQYYEEISEELVQPIVEEWILPDALNEVADDDEIFDTFSPAELKLIDEVIVESMLSEKLVEASLKGQVISPQELEAMRIGAEVQLNNQGSKRQITNIKEFIKKEVLGGVTVHSSDERRNKQNQFQSYAAALQMFAENDPARLAIRDRILDQMGVTREELSLYVEEAAAMVGMQSGGTIDPESLQEDEKVAQLG